MEQILLAQIEKFYDSGGLINSAYLYDDLYDFLTKEGTFPNLSQEVKNELWAAARIKVRLDRADEKALHKYYKSFLIKHYLNSKLPEKLHLTDEHGKRLTKLYWKGERD